MSNNSIELALINRKSSFVSDGVKMATPMRRTLVALHRATCSSLMVMRHLITL